VRFVLIFVMVVAPAFGQGYELHGGDSTLMQAEGGQAKLTFANGSETSVGGGVLSGHVYGGLTQSISYKGYAVKAGDISLPFNLMTDYYGGGGFPAMGVAVSRGNKESQDIWTAFAGATSEQVVMPYFFGGRTSEATVAFFWTHKINPNWTFQSSEVVADKQTAIEEIQFQPIQPLTLALGTGIGADSPFAAARVGWKGIHFNGAANYTERSQNFRRIVLPYATIVENLGLNANATFVSQYFGAALSHSTTESNLSPTRTVTSTGNSLGVNAQASIFSVDGSEYLGSTAGVHTSGQSAGAGVNSQFLTVRVSGYHAQGRTIETAIVTERFERFSLNQFVEKHAVDLGGSYTGNTMSVSAGYQMTYLPILGTFEKTLVAQVTVQLPNALILQGSTLTTPDGKTRYSIGTTKYGQGPYGQAQEASVSGKFLYSGAVVDVEGKPVIGASVTLGKMEVWTNHEGVFKMPSRKNKTLPVAVVVEDFMTPGRFKIVTAPASMNASEHIQIIVSLVSP
jgi:hypothetical protein